MTAQPKKQQRLGILVGGGPAPGINGVIAAATVEALRHGLEVVGIYDGFKRLAAGDASGVRPLGRDEADQIRFRGGSFLRTARENPTKDEKKMQNVVAALQSLGLDYLVTIGGDDTALSAMRTAERVSGAIRVAHVPKTIDNDLPLPNDVPTFGFTTARDVGARSCANLREDVKTTGRWAIVVTQGRSAGHLALGIGTAAGANITVIGEEFAPQKNIALAAVCAAVEGAIFKARALGQPWGVAVLAEGLCDLTVADLAADRWKSVVTLKKDDFGNVHVSDVPLALIVTRLLQERAKQRGDGVGFVYATFGYELRCADPVPYDCEYTQALGWGAVRYLLQRGEKSWSPAGAMITMVHGELVPRPFTELINAATGKTQVRFVNMNSDGYAAARERMIRLEREDFEDDAQVERLARAAGMTAERFRADYGPGNP
jgi:6-phosphofructokinase 1